MRIGLTNESLHLDPSGEIALDVIIAERHNKLALLVSPDELNSASENSIVGLGIVPYKKWRVVALGAVCVGISTDTHDPVLHFGTRADVDAFGIMTVTSTGSTNVHLDDYSSRDKYAILPADALQTGIAVVWSGGAGWDVWQKTIQELQVKAIGGTQSGKWQTWALIEIDTGGKW